MKSLLVLALLLLASISYAQLGKNEDDCDSKFGIPTERTEYKDGTFSKRYKDVYLSFHKDVCYSIRYDKVGQSDVLSILKENSQKSKWVLKGGVLKDEDNEGTWNRKDGKAQAVWTRSAKTLWITDPSAYEEIRSKNASNSSSR